MKLEIAKFLTDILKSIELVDLHLQGIESLTEFQKNLTVSDAVQRRVSIIGEALWKADKIEKIPGITDKSKIISLRHILVHDYDLIDESSIWLICKKYLPILRNEVETLLKDK